jgi:arylsulfatase A-like enzyme
MPRAGRWREIRHFEWTKQVASSYGGTRNGMVVHWPKRITAKGEVRSQWHHVIDIAPTILEATGLPEPKSVNGTPQTPIEGVSMVRITKECASMITTFRQPFAALLIALQSLR